MFGAFRPLEEYVGPSIATLGALPFVVFLDCMLTFTSESACLSFVELEVSTVIWILEFYYLD
jgi:hypothetical protein